MCSGRWVRVRSSIEIEEMSGRFSAVIVGTDPKAQGTAQALRWVLYPNVEDETLLRDIPG